MNDWMLDNPGVLWLIGPLVILDLVLKGFALWRAARRGQQIWFVALLVVNSAGILPAIYLFLNREAPEKARKKK